MKAQQMHDYIIKPALEYMQGNYDSKNARMLLLATAAIESYCGKYIKQVNGPVLGIFQMEPITDDDIWSHCDALFGDLGEIIGRLSLYDFSQENTLFHNHSDLVVSPLYACAMARLKYSMDSQPLPAHNDKEAIYEYYKRIYNTEHGKSTYSKFIDAWDYCDLDDINLGE